MRLAIVASHPIQYYAPLYRTLARRLDLAVFYAHRATADDQARAGFGVDFNWDVDLLSGYEYVFLRNVARTPDLHSFFGCDTPEIGVRLTEGGFDAVLVQGWHIKSFLQALVAARRKGLPVLVRGDSHLGTRRSAFTKAAKRLIYPAFLRLFDAALYVGERSKAYWAHYQYPAERLFFSPHCVDADWFTARATSDARVALRTRLGIAPDAKVMLYAGKLVPFKRPLDVVVAAARLKAERHEFAILVAGAGPLKDELTAAAQAAGVSFYALGFCNQTEMPAAYAAADVLVLPSDGRETWGLVANEALACRRPIVVSDATGCAPDLAGDGSAGRVFPMGNENALAAAIVALVESPPSPTAIAAKSAAYSLDGACDGIVRAAASVTRRPSQRTT